MVTRKYRMKNATKRITVIKKEEIVEESINIIYLIIVKPVNAKNDTSRK